MTRVARVLQPLLDLPRAAKRMILALADALLCVLAVWIAFYVRLGEWFPDTQNPIPAVIGSILLALPVFTFFGVYRAVSRYAQEAVMALLIRANVAYGLCYALVFTTVGISGVPRTIGLIQPAVLFILMLNLRIGARYLLDAPRRAGLTDEDSARVLIYGAGNSGRQLSAALTNRGEMRVAGYVDDDPQLQGATINGVRVFGREILPVARQRLGVTEILLAIPSAPRTRRNEILENLRNFGVAVRTLPDLMHVARGESGEDTIQELDIGDLLGRAAVAPDEDVMRSSITGRTVLVTGAGGSIGSELCRQIVKSHPAQLLLFDSSEFSLYAIHRELERAVQLLDPDADKIRIVPLLGSVRDEHRVTQVIACWTPDLVYHAAAYKHVPLVEHNLIEGVANNTFGTLTVARACIAHQIPRFVLVSTDKAVRPTNVMGASKRLAEMALQALQQEGGRTCFAMVRFGNVLDSSGSVVPVFRHQIAHGGPITITDFRITRFFMTIPEAAQLVIQAGAMASGGEVFLLDMGEPVRIVDLALNMIELSGRTVKDANSPYGDIELQEIGLRPGEKLYEELLIDDTASPTSHPRIRQARESFIPLRQLQPQLRQLEQLLTGSDATAVRDMVRKLVREFSPNTAVADWVELEMASTPMKASARSSG